MRHSIIRLLLSLAVFLTAGCASNRTEGADEGSNEAPRPLPKVDPRIERAMQATSDILDYLDRGDYGGLYDDRIHSFLQSQMRRAAFIELMHGELGEALTDLCRALVAEDAAVLLDEDRLRFTTRGHLPHTFVLEMPQRKVKHKTYAPPDYPFFPRQEAILLQFAEDYDGELRLYDVD